MEATTIILSGELARKFGRIHKRYLEVPSPKEAIEALHNTIEGFQDYFVKNGHRYFHVFAGKQDLGEQDLARPTGKRVIRITPAIAGAKKQGVFQMILGAVLVVVGVISNYFYPGNPIGGKLISAGIAMMLGGLASLIFAPRNKTGEDKKNDPSFIFSGAVNTLAQGNVIPVAYGGPMEVGSAVASAGISSVTIPLSSTGGIGGGSSGGGDGAGGSGWGDSSDVLAEL